MAQRIAERKLKKKAGKKKRWVDYWDKNKNTIKGIRRDLYAHNKAAVIDTEGKPKNLINERKGSSTRMR